MKTFLIGLLVLGTQTAFGLGPLLKYSYGNPTTSSELSISLDGTIQRTEKYGGGLQPVALPEVMLTADTRKKLFEAIQAVYQNGHTVVPGHEAAPGSSSGSLKAFSMNGPIVIRTIDRGKPRDKDTVTYSPIAEARWIETLVFSLVQNRMYLIESGGR
jgi:hypothetical protein